MANSRGNRNLTLMKWLLLVIFGSISFVLLYHFRKVNNELATSHPISLLSVHRKGNLFKDVGPSPRDEFFPNQRDDMYPAIGGLPVDPQRDRQRDTDQRESWHRGKDMGNQDASLHHSQESVGVDDRQVQQQPDDNDALAREEDGLLVKSTEELSRLAGGRLPDERSCRLKTIHASQVNASFVLANMQVPYLVTGEVETWPAFNKWTVEYLQNKIGEDTVVKPLLFRTKCPENSKRFYCQDKTYGSMSFQTFLRLANFLPRAEAQRPAGMSEADFDSRVYLRMRFAQSTYKATMQNAERVNTLFKEDCPVPSYVGRMDWIHTAVWLGGAHVRTPMHLDPWPGFLAQIRGHKVITLVPKAVYSRNRAQLSNFAKLSPHEFDIKLAKFLPKEDYSRCLVSPGDFVYVPPNWGHDVYALDETISIPLRSFFRRDASKRGRAG